MKYKLRSKCCVKNLELSKEVGIVEYVNDILPDKNLQETKINKTIRLNKNKNREEINKVMKKNQLR